MQFVGYYNGEIGELQQMKVPMLDRAVYFGDGCNVNLGTNPHRNRFVSILVDLFSSEIIVKHYHFSILLVAMDIISRYLPLLAPLESIRYQLLTIFITGLNSNRERSRDRAVSSLARFVASIKEGIIPYQQGILDAVQVRSGFEITMHRT